VALAGWLFADFLLAAAVIFLATSPGATQPLPTPVPPGVQPPTPTPLPPTPTPIPCNTTVVLRKNEFTVRAAAGGGDPTDAQLQDAFRQYATQQAGILLTFGHNSSIPAAVTEATRVNDKLRRLFPTLFPPSAIMENYYSGEPATGDVNFILYLIASDCNPGMGAPPGAPPAAPGAPPPGAPAPAPAAPTATPLPPGAGLR